MLKRISTYPLYTCIAKCYNKGVLNFDWKKTPTKQTRLNSIFKWLKLKKYINLYIYEYQIFINCKIDINFLRRNKRIRKLIINSNK